MDPSVWVEPLRMNSCVPWVSHFLSLDLVKGSGEGHLE